MAPVLHFAAEENERRAWSDATLDLGRNPHNDVPLVTSPNALFNVGLIGFDNDNRMLCSPSVGHGRPCQAAVAGTVVQVAHRSTA
jgi:hypothetical protein